MPDLTKNMPEPIRKIWSSSHARAIICILIISVAVFLSGMRTIDGWHINWDNGSIFAEDARQGIALIKSIHEDGIKGAYFNDMFGAPDGSSLIDVPFLDFLFILEAWVIGFFTSSPTATFFTIYILTFVLDALGMYFLLCRFVKSDLIRTVFSVVASILPYHLMRNFGHLTLSNYWIVPLGIWLAIFIATLRPGTREGGKGYWQAFAVAALVGLGNAYYVFFSLLLMMVAWVCQAATVRVKKNILMSTGMILTTIGTFYLTLLPGILYSMQNGENIDACNRFPWETSLYGMRLSQLLLPPPYSTWGTITNYYNDTYGASENSFSTLGIVAVIGLAILVVVTVVRICSGYQFNRVLTVLPLFVLALLLWCSIGGLADLFSLIITPEIRATNRASIFIAIICILAVAMVLDICLARNLKYLRWPLVLILTLIIGFAGCYEGLRGRRLIAYRQQAEDINNNIIDFYNEVEASVPAGTMVYEIPFMLFPETPPINNLHDNSQFEAYIYTDTLKWSYGGVRGRDMSAEELWIDEGQSRAFVDGIKEAGFGGVLIFGEAYEDGGEAICKFYQEELGLTPILGKNEHEKRYFFDLSPLE